LSGQDCWDVQLVVACLRSFCYAHVRAMDTLVLFAMFWQKSVQSSWDHVSTAAVGMQIARTKHHKGSYSGL